MGRTGEKHLNLPGQRYRNVSKKEHSSILLELVMTTGYHRKYATALLNGRRQRSQPPVKRPRRAIYGLEKAGALLSLSHLSDHTDSGGPHKALDAK